MRLSFHLSLILLFVALLPCSVLAWDAKRDNVRAEVRILEPMKPIALWPGVAPGDKGDIGEEKDTTDPKEDKNSPNYVIRLGNVTQPTITVYPPEKAVDTGAAIVVCPGGGYNILAMNLE